MYILFVKNKKNDFLIYNLNETYKNIQDATNISKIPSLTYHQRDSLWAKFLTAEDSVPGGYWDILKQKTGGRNPKELSVQRPVQK